jgi:hypothetical protein
MKSIAIAAALFLSLSLSAQVVTITRDTTIHNHLNLVLSNDSSVSPGMSLKTGRGTMPNGDFKYINTSSTSFLAVMSQDNRGGNSAIMPLKRSYSGLLLTVKSVKKIGNKKRGFKYVVIVGGGNIVNYELELEDAIATGEIIL